MVAVAASVVVASVVVASEVVLLMQELVVKV